ncbi:MotA/TolQ/ExbB proton channel family protein [Spectribacter hydrogenoxidans]|uniref:MotA/TolQ/ExbB proton channel family protein n=1 Tax=Spectribacter hydrogenoxidans TaxID=3075608 RepID=A0ABU3C0L4_9GAMM|nr:MotA/TolQ/ExbB proton channel family protein [Salinisphaera sp. W335]MDT0634909.1 MotA/TolQ/ExbB proton channel family protein [Salinisphaera sp. W335]
MPEWGVIAALAPDWFGRFIDTGGDILWAILFVTVLLWTLILERLWFYRFVFPRRVCRWQEEWRARSDHSSWRARAIRRLIVSRANAQLRAGLPAIRNLIALCPLLGLLGTVTGMIQVFDVMALKGTSDARAMASGVSQATIPTMAGMVVALSGLYFGTRFPQRAARETRRLADRLDIRGGGGGHGKA